jgi:hypothetical protein
VFNDSIFDVVQIQLFSKLPYQSFHLTDPSKIVVDIFGATSNTNWIDQLSNLKAVKKVNYEQISDDIFRVYISLQHTQHWGHQIYYSGNNLIVKIFSNSFTFIFVRSGSKNSFDANYLINYFKVFLNKIIFHSEIKNLFMICLSVYLLIQICFEFIKFCIIHGRIFFTNCYFISK